LMIEKEKIKELFRKGKVDDVNILLLGTTWGIKYQVEKSIIDQLKHITRQQKCQGILTSWVLSKDKLREILGIRNPIKNQMLTENEQKFLSESFTDALSTLKEEDKEEKDEPDQRIPSNIEQLKKLYERLKDSQKKLGGLKHLTETVVSERSILVFKNKKNKKLLKEKKPLKELLANVQTEPQYGNVMNPGLIYSKGVEKLTISPDLTTRADKEVAKVAIQNFCKKYSLDQSRYMEILSYYPFLQEGE